MNVLKKIKEKLYQIYTRNFSLLIFAVGIAIIVWFMVSMTVYPSIPKTISGIKLDTDISGTVAAENNLSLISCNVDEVSVKILGSRAQIGNLSNENLRAVLKIDNVSTTGTKSLSIGIVCDDPKIEFQVDSVYPSTAAVVLDKFETRSFKVTPSVPNVSYSEGKIRNDDEFVCDPETINITGPSAQLDKIDKVSVISNKKMQLDESYTFNSEEIKLFTEDGSTIEQSQMKFGNTNFMINVPVLTQKTVGLTVGIVGAPSGFDKESLKFDYTVDSITVASQTSKLSDISDTIEIGKVMLSDLRPGYTKTFPIELDDYINMSNVDSVTVTLDDTDLAVKTLVIDQFSVSNAPSDYNFEVLTKRLEIEMVGPEDIIESLTSNDIVADINLLNASSSVMQGTSFNYDVTISCPNYSNVWSATQSKAILSRTEKQTGYSEPDEE